MDSPKRILVTGATGRVGRGVVDGLLDAGARVRALVRRLPVGAGDPRVELVVGDLAAPGAWLSDIGDVDAAFLVWPLFSTAGLGAFLAALAPRTHVVYLSAAGAATDDGDPPALFHSVVERAITAAGFPRTFLRPTGFAANTLAWVAQIRAHGRVRWPFADARRSLVHEADVSAVAVRTLLDVGHAGRAHLLTGPACLTQREQVRVIGEAIGRTLAYDELDVDTARAELLAVWGNAAFVDAALAGWAAMVERPELVTDAVARVTGKPARSFAEWVRDHAADFGGEVAA